MKLQKATQLGLYAVIELALDPTRQLSAAEIAAKYGVSTNHLAKVMRDLGRAGLVDSLRGVGGGYRFAGNAKRVTLFDIIELFEDIGPGAGDGADTLGGQDVGRALHIVLAEIDDIARATLRSITIETLLKLMRANIRTPMRNQAPAKRRGAQG